MKNVLLNLMIVLLIAGGVGILLYPAVSNSVNERNSSTVITSYEKKSDEIGVEDKDQVLEEAYAYNRELPQLLTDHDAAEIAGSPDYLDTLCLSESGIMGVLEFERLDICLPIYHGADEDTLRSGIGHVPGTSLPVGGESSHAVLSAHTGLPSKKLFTNLDEAQIGDMFTITVLDELLVYKVDQINITLPQDTEDLTIIDGGDYVTLLTCTPYGINTHRLHVRGVRITYEEAAKAGLFIKRDAVELDKLVLIPFAAVPVLLIYLIAMTVRGRRRRSEEAAKIEI